jgi:molybdopterin molybdotransferase
MPEFFHVRPVRDALEALFAACALVPHTEHLPTASAVGRVLSHPPISPIDLPSFPRATMDGYAVQARDTFGASAALPVYLTCVGVVAMGAEPTFTIGSGQAAEIYTGGMLPPGADAVVMLERTQPISAAEIEVLSPVAPGENVVQVGEDVAQGGPILPAGHRLRPQDIGGLLAVGVLSVDVAARPRLAILSSGDELVPPHVTPLPGQVRDINSYTLAALAEAAGALPHMLGIARDKADELAARARHGLDSADMLVLTAGSSHSSRDLTRQVIEGLGNPGILQHGLAVKPGKPTLIAACEGKPVIGLPGNPASALLVARQLILPILARMQGQVARPAPSVRATLSASVASATGREDSIPVSLLTRDGTLIAAPVFGKSNLIYTLVNADGVVEIPLNSGGLSAGAEVEVFLF